MTLLVFLLGVSATPAAAYQSLADAIRADAKPSGRGDLPEEAVQYIIDTCSLGWQTSWPTTASIGGVDVRAYVAQDRDWCILTHANYGEWGQGGNADYALVNDTTGLAWVRSGSIVAPPIIHSGTVALLQRAGEPEWPRLPVQLLVLNAAGDTLIARNWE